ncbi:type I-E CRISPR-associated protein Cas7/Cse4/CasC [Rhodospirillum rubrum]|uniref:CRISPR-associated protein, Cse4 family n=1 Tax=Rhodospirillum rubrum (strain ATCC 11170 / ATH 1.1.1 / DSM 467 / LMG 4362 / NCIMB 8255 / S1) TaxID=269796 RepID=Q2RXJ6_RHORT|nr:type I-E CRISPR-associated protein Cas7/Cse4/CasC [Rhodospirillum rubrum]ABC21149.1 CRISPR-associated protein, Cse4 family [Rhodospirillum rubrum ATCC 11170]AEO46820.1 CRISPR-associated Cse4 family protein [Rhodospirillum rubrum F11]MBK5952697.1 type I-E CRISPR-associated protein Cas7/Cse4/CasC [Rhodospirillum rubrum]QXG80840.1 type I-E CRISPR-associated protein Cas7/Cse4/CasC [Rhodospirillum rubrum]HAP98567.1 type I-E CRISPR-associated protein Cas7/Cse4/CasC [Rhodospirillum rubrum]
MTPSRFLQIHSLHSYTAALLNRDDSGLAKRLTYGGSNRTRISSQCLKRHWRMAEHDPHALQTLGGYVGSFRSRELVTDLVIKPLEGRYPQDILDVLEPEFQKLVYGDKADKGKKSRQTLLLGQPELAWLARRAEELAAGANDAKALQKAVADWRKDANFKAMSENAALPGGLVAALFGRMVTSDPAANIDAPVHVAHAFTVHAEEAEGDYFTAVDDLKKDESDSGADTIQETELTSGLFYGYVVIDLPGLIGNCGGDKEIAAQVVNNLVYLIAEVSPGAKLGSTAPYGRADLMLIEAGDRQPRSLATAYRKAIAPDREQAVAALDGCLAKLDATYETGEARRYLSLAETPLTGPATSGLEKLSLKALADWTASRVKEAPDA